MTNTEQPQKEHRTNDEEGVAWLQNGLNIISHLIKRGYIMEEMESEVDVYEGRLKARMVAIVERGQSVDKMLEGFEEFHMEASTIANHGISITLWLELEKEFGAEEE